MHRGWNAIKKPTRLVASKRATAGRGSPALVDARFHPSGWPKVMGNSVGHENASQPAWPERALSGPHGGIDHPKVAGIRRRSVNPHDETIRVADLTPSINPCTISVGLHSRQVHARRTSQGGQARHTSAKWPTSGGAPQRVRAA